ncbi:DUF4435 domain-containing protein [Cryomorphaceae bacterium 1068]|nr:DUF4435 domain-containing protein [Cryomorphaceae bacterium 1068]
MSERLERFRKARTSASSVFAQVIQLNKKYDNPLYCCFEGEDYKYYGIRIESYKEKDYQKIIPLKCGGKKEVVRLYALIDKETTLNIRPFVYFIDRDFDNPIDKDEFDMYETPCYSVENLYTTTCAFERILVNELKVEETDELYEHCVKLFAQRQSEFHSGISLLNGWIYCQRRNEDPDNRLNLSSFNLNSLIETFNLSSVDFIDYDIAYLESEFDGSLSVEIDEVNTAREILDTNPQELYRGKFEIEFLYNFLTQLVQSINKKEAPFETRTKVRLNISKVNLISELSQYAKTPSCLKEHIKKSA